MISFKNLLVVSAVAVLLVAVTASGEDYENKRALRQAAPETAEIEEADDSECGSLEMAEEENAGSSNKFNQGGETNTYNQTGETNTYNQGGWSNTYNQGGETNTYNQGDETNTWGAGGTGATDTSQFTQGEYGDEADNQKFTDGAQSQSDINFSSFQGMNNAGTVSPQ